MLISLYNKLHFMWTNNFFFFCAVNYFGNIMKAVVLVEVQIHIFKTWTLNVCERLVSLFDRFCPRASPGTANWVGPRARRRA